MMAERPLLMPVQVGLHRKRSHVRAFYYAPHKRDWSLFAIINKENF